MKITLSEEVGDFEKIRENFKKIMKFLISGDSNVIRLQSESIDFSGLGANSTIRTWTVFMQSDTGDCNITITSPRTFASSVINQNNTIWIFKGVSGAGVKTVSVSGSGDTIEGASSIEIANDQTIAIQSNGEEYKVLFDSTGGGSGGGRFGIEDNLGIQNRLIDMEGFAIELDSLSALDFYAGDMTFIGNNVNISMNTIAAFLRAQSSENDFTQITSAAASAIITGQDNIGNNIIFTLSPTTVTISKNSASPKQVAYLNIEDDYPDDTAAATGGILVGQCYHSSGVVKIRLT